MYLISLAIDLYLQEAGIEVDPYGDLNTETERKLGELVRDKSVNLLKNFVFLKNYLYKCKMHQETLG